MSVFGLCFKAPNCYISTLPGTPGGKDVAMVGKIMIAVVFASLLTVSGTFSLGTVSAFEDTLVIESLRTIDGAITGIDTDAKRVTVRWMFDPVMIQYQDVTLNVPDTCSITKESETSELMELENGDHVTVRYDQNAEPLPRAISIVVS